MASLSEVKRHSQSNLEELKLTRPRDIWYLENQVDVKRHTFRYCNYDSIYDHAPNSNTYSILKPLHGGYTIYQQPNPQLKSLAFTCNIIQLLLAVPF